MSNTVGGASPARLRDPGLSGPWDTMLRISFSLLWKWLDWNTCIHIYRSSCECHFIYGFSHEGLI